MSVNGKPAYVHPDLHGDEVCVRGPQAEMSREFVSVLWSLPYYENTMAALFLELRVSHGDSPRDSCSNQ